MLSDDLLQNVLLDPANEPGVDRLQIVSGYGSAGMASRHMEKLREMRKEVSIELILGMACKDGISDAQHQALCQLAKNRLYDMDFSCSYVVSGGPVHAKAYCWMDGSQPIKAFVGSANYSQAAFDQLQQENMTDADPAQVAAFQARVRSNAQPCSDVSINGNFFLYKAERKLVAVKDHVRLSFLDNKEETPKRSGINWGQRPGRDNNQAYISIPSENRSFFPPRKEHFAVQTDDGEVLIMVRAQDDGKALHTPHDNAHLGLYLRQRMGLPSGIYVTRKHFEDYGRTHVSFSKTDKDEYQLDFSVSTRR